MFTACGKSDTAYDSEKDVLVEVAIADLVQIPSYNYLYYSVTNRTVYYAFVTDYYSERAGFFGPYIRNGHYCEYIDGEIVEVIPTVRIEDVTN